jgi:hypothetical protein
MNDEESEDIFSKRKVIRDQAMLLESFCQFYCLLVFAQDASSQEDPVKYANAIFASWRKRMEKEVDRILTENKKDIILNVLSDDDKVKGELQDNLNEIYGILISLVRKVSDHD